MPANTPPHWDLTNVYPSLSSLKFNADFKKLQKMISELEVYFQTALPKADETAKSAVLAETAATLIDRFNAILLVAGTLGAYIQSFVSTNSYDKEALKKESEFDMVSVKLEQLGTQATAWIGKWPSACLILSS